MGNHLILRQIWKIKTNAVAAYAVDRVSRFSKIATILKQKAYVTSEISRVFAFRNSKAFSKNTVQGI